MAYVRTMNEDGGVCALGADEEELNNGSARARWKALEWLLSSALLLLLSRLSETTYRWLVVFSSRAFGNNEREPAAGLVVAAKLGTKATEKRCKRFKCFLISKMSHLARRGRLIIAAEIH